MRKSTLMLPEMDGLSMCRVLRKESDVPVTMLTACWPN